MIADILGMVSISVCDALTLLSASKTPAAVGLAEESHLQTDTRSAGRSGPDGPSKDRENRPGVSARKHTGIFLHNAIHSTNFPSISSVISLHLSIHPICYTLQFVSL